MSPDSLVRMANDIAHFFIPQKGDAATAIADHLVKFWDRRMRAGIVAHLAEGGAGLEPAARAAVEILARAGAG